jgi:hypothetical protein
MNHRPSCQKAVRRAKAAMCMYMYIYTCKFKREIFPVHAMKGYRGRIVIAPLLLNLDTRWR